MSRLMVLVVAMLMMLIAASTAENGVEAQDGIEATIEALETQLADAESTSAALGAKINDQRTEIAELSGDAPTPAAGGAVDGDEAAAPEAADAPQAAVDTSLFGASPDSLPEGEASIVAVIATGDPVRSSLPVVLRNNTGADVTVTQVVGVARGDDGKLVASSSFSTLAPALLTAGQVGVGYVYFDIDELTPDLDFEMEAQAEPAGGDFAFLYDFVIAEAELTEDGVVGIATNPLSETLSSGSVVGVCFSGDGAVVGYLSGSADKTATAAGDDTSFSATFRYPNEDFGDAVTALNTCELYLIGIAGFAF